jgi:hypothetical protein
MRSSAARDICQTGLVLVALAGCSLPLGASSGPQPSPEAVAACNKRADQEFLSQNRNALYQEDRYQTSTRDAPYASTGMPQQNESGLSAQHEQRQDVRNCLNGAESPGITADNPSRALPGTEAPTP